MMIKPTVVLLAAVLAGLMLRDSATADQDGPDRPFHVGQFDGGGGLRQSAQWIIRDSIGPMPQGVGRKVSDSFEGRAGLFYQTTEMLRGDLNEDGRLDSKDLLLLALSWRTRPGHPNYRFTADLYQQDGRQQMDENDLLAWLKLHRRRRSGNQ